MDGRFKAKKKALVDMIFWSKLKTLSKIFILFNEPQTFIYSFTMKYRKK